MYPYIAIFKNDYIFLLILPLYTSTRGEPKTREMNFHHNSLTQATCMIEPSL